MESIKLRNNKNLPENELNSHKISSRFELFTSLKLRVAVHTALLLWMKMMDRRCDVILWICDDAAQRVQTDLSVFTRLTPEAAVGLASTPVSVQESSTRVVRGETLHSGHAADGGWRSGTGRPLIGRVRGVRLQQTAETDGKTALPEQRTSITEHMTDMITAWRCHVWSFSAHFRPQRILSFF